MVGAASVLAAVYRAPLTGSLLLFELTKDYDIILPLMASAGVASLLVELVQTKSPSGASSSVTASSAAARGVTAETATLAGAERSAAAGAVQTLPIGYVEMVSCIFFLNVVVLCVSDSAHEAKLVLKSLLYRLPNSSTSFRMVIASSSNAYPHVIATERTQ
jgi:Voltage gated chloride channel